MFKNIRMLFSLALVFIFLGLAGCATLFSEHEDTIYFDSDLKGVKAYIDGEFAGNLPFEVTLDREVFKQKMIVFKKKGYITYETKIKKSLNNIALFNLTSGPSWTTDAISGAMIEYHPKRYMIELKPRRGNNAQLDLYRSKIYVGMTYKPLLLDIARGQGEYLDALVGVIVKGDAEQQALVSYIQVNRKGLVSSATPMMLHARLNAGVME